MSKFPFWHEYSISQYGENVALYDAQFGTQFTYKQLTSAVNQVAAYLERKTTPDQKLLIALEANQHPLTIIIYLAALSAGHCVWLLNPALSEDAQKQLLNTFDANLWIRPSQLSISEWRTGLSDKCIAHTVKVLSTHCLAIHQDLALLLSTSGSTGTGQLVRLSYQNLQANSEAINLVLPIECNDRVMLNLPLHYSFGLSIVNTHLATGAAIVMSEHSVIAREFWQAWKTYKCTALYGVPYSYEMLNRLRLSRLPLETVRYLAHAGGPLNQTDWQALKEWSETTTKPVYSMYGQTEATARMAILNPERFIEKYPAIGSAIPNGLLRIVDECGDSVAQGNAGELMYQGDNVMMGLAHSIADLADGSGKQILATGDIAYQDKEGDFVIIGRKKRFVKITGHRISLDATEQWVKAQPIEGKVLTQVACAGSDDSLQCCVADSLDEEQQQMLRKKLAGFLNVHPRYCQVICVESIPRTASGKVNYAALKDVA